MTGQDSEQLTIGDVVGFLVFVIGVVALFAVVFTI